MSSSPISIWLYIFARYVFFLFLLCFVKTARVTPPSPPLCLNRGQVRQKRGNMGSQCLDKHMVVCNTHHRTHIADESQPYPQKHKDTKHLSSSPQLLGPWVVEWQGDIIAHSGKKMENAFSFPSSFSSSTHHQYSNHCIVLSNFGF